MKVAQKTYRLYKIQKRNSPVQFCMGLYKQKTREIILKFFVQEAQIGFEPVIRELQTYAPTSTPPHPQGFHNPSDPHDHLKSTLLYGGSRFSKLAKL